MQLPLFLLLFANNNQNHHHHHNISSPHICLICFNLLSSRHPTTALPTSIVSQIKAQDLQLNLTSVNRTLIQIRQSYPVPILHRTTHHPKNNNMLDLVKRKSWQQHHRPTATLKGSNSVSGKLNVARVLSTFQRNTNKK